MMKAIPILLMPIFLVSLLTLTGCGPSKSELRTELRRIDGEMAAIRIEMARHRTLMNQAEMEALFGSFAAGYGATSGDYRLAGEGAGVASDAIHQYDFSEYSLGQLHQRYAELGKSRTIIQSRLK